MRARSIDREIGLRLSRLFRLTEMLAFATKRGSPIAAGVMIASSAGSVYAANLATYVSQCTSCQTTTDFTTAATSSARTAQLGDGVYEVVSASHAESAYIQVRGQWGPKNGRYSVTTTIPVDTSGNSIAGNSESANESFYTGLDQVIFGASRSAPTTINEPESYSGSFINSSEEEVEPGIGYALGQMGINPGSIAVGTVITVKFQDGTTAQYVKVSSTATYQWTWNGIAHNKDGKLMDRAGNVISNSSTTGAGGGSVSTPGFGAGSTWLFDLLGGGDCTFVTTITVDGEASDYMNFSPC